MRDRDVVRDGEVAREPWPTGVRVSTEDVRSLLAAGNAPGDVVRLLVATGAWSESGATEIVSTLDEPSAPHPEPGMPEGDDGWPGPIEEPPPLFAR
jgi:hypothetical protein